MHNEKSQLRAALDLARQAAEEAGGQPPCSNAPDLWFDASTPETAGIDAREIQANVQRAKRLCHSCEILVQCRTYAIKFNEPFGIWGATTPRERRVMNRLMKEGNHANPNN